MKISWVVPVTNYDDLERYEIEITNSLGNWQVDTVTCDGADLTIKTDQECFVPLLTLINNFGLIQGDPVVVRVAATNSIGVGEYVQLTGVKVETYP